MQRRSALLWLFRAFIVVATAVAVWLILTGTVGGRLLIGRAKRLVGLQPAGDLIAATRMRFERVFRRLDRPEKTLLEVGGMSPAEAIYAQANFDSVLVFSSKVMTRDERRGYRMRPNSRAIWLKWLMPGGLPTSYLLLPDNEAVRRAAAAADMPIISEERYNSRGFRGPEPDPGADLRVLELGDSFLQGAYLPEDQTPSAFLQRYLAEHCPGIRVSVLNTGTPGYSTEQEYWTLVAEYASLRPNVVIVHFFANDVHHNYLAVLHKGKGDWSTAAGWLERIREFCKSKGVPIFLVSVVPGKQQMWTADVSNRNYQARLLAELPLARADFIDPLDTMAARNLELRNLLARGDHCSIKAAGQGAPHAGRLAGTVAAGAMVTDPDCPMFLKDDAHFSSQGARCYAEVVGRHVLARWQSWCRRRVGPRRSGSH